MKKNEPTSASVNLVPLLAISLLTLLGVIAGLVMLWGLHNKVPKAQAAPKAKISIDEIGAVSLDKNVVRINLMKRNSSGTVEKAQQVEIPLENFVSGGFQRFEGFMNKMIEEGIIERQ